jgi:hypothetical protein
MQAFRWDVVRARTELGIAIAARKAMIATTIMISTRVQGQAQGPAGNREALPGRAQLFHQDGPAVQIGPGI